MIDQENLKKFNDIYNKTYNDILKYIVIKCHNMNDVNDILQDTYFELWNIMGRRELDDKNIKSFIIGIAINKIKKHYKLIYRINSISIFQKNEQDEELIDMIKSEIMLEDLVIKDEEWVSIWEYLKKKKNPNIAKIFYLHYKLEFTIKEIAESLSISESTIKSIIYRTINELSLIYGKDVG